MDTKFRHWPEGPHDSEDWEYLGSYHFVGVSGNLPQKGDVYRHKRKESYKGVSVQYGPEEPQYFSNCSVYKEDVPLSLEGSIMLGYAIVAERLGSRNEG